MVKKVIFLIICIIAVILLIIFLPQEKTRLKKKDYPIIENLDLSSDLVKGLYSQIQIFNDDFKTDETYLGYLYKSDELYANELDNMAILAIGLNQLKDLDCNNNACNITTTLLNTKISEVLGNVSYDNEDFSERINGIKFKYINNQYVGSFNDYDTNGYVKVYSNLIESKKTTDKDKTFVSIKERVAYRLYNVMNETYEVYDDIVMVNPLKICPYLDNNCIEDYIDKNQNKFSIYEYIYTLENDKYIFNSIKKSN